MSLLLICTVPMGLWRCGILSLTASCALCSYNAECMFDEARLYYYCQCKSGYTGDGRSCLLIDAPQENTTTPYSSTTESKNSPLASLIFYINH